MKFDESYELLADMYADSYYPKKLTDKVKNHIKQAISALEQGQKDPAKVQKIFDKMTAAINRLEEEFEDAGSELETSARDCIATDVMYILDWFELELDVEEALREREW